ncbi:MAG: DUF4416 family protein [Candidatus Omnitrophota bacterium]
MGTAIKPQKVKLIFGLISSDEELFTKTQKLLTGKFGPIDFSSKILPFNLTDYYREELGKNLKRKFISCQKLIRRESISEIKVFTNKIEKKFSFLRKRRINIDPGYLSPGKLILATTKDYGHRLYLKKGIFAEVTLFYKRNSFHPWQWTFPDYKTESYLEIFNHLYKIYIEQLKRKK